MRAAASILLLSLAALPARADVTRDQPLIEETGHTLNQGEWKLGIGTSSYGITDRLQVDSALLVDLGILNAGLKYKLVDAPNLALSLNAWGGGSTILLLANIGLFYAGARVDASMPLTEELSISLNGGWQMWQVSSVGQASDLLAVGRLAWWHLEGILQWVVTPRHILFLSLGTPTSWIATMGGTHDFDAFDFANGSVGYQLSYGVLNVRIDVGWGPSLLGRGPTAGLDFYVRF